MNIPVPLIKDISRGRCLPFIGAGFSKNADLPAGMSMPDWAELTGTLARDAGTSKGLGPPMVAQRYEEKYGRVQLIEAIRDELHADKARPGLAHRAFARLPFDTVYTTNFDLLLEHAYGQEGRPLRSLAGEQQIPFHAGQTAASTVKMHGDLRHEEHVIITQNDYNNFLTRYPVIATHLSAMLITRTPLFIGYSLSDPDFDSIRNVVRSRLGPFVRMAYVVQFDADQAAIEAGYKENLHIISLPTANQPSRDHALEAFFLQIQSHLDKKATADLRNSRPDAFETLAPDVVMNTPDQMAVAEATSRLCFVMMGFTPRSDEIYRTLITSAVEAAGLAPVRADEMIGQGFIMEQIKTAIQQSRLCIADVTGSNPNVLYEIGLAHAIKKPLILLAQEGSVLPFDIAHQRTILYGSDFAAAGELLQHSISVTLGSRLHEAHELLNIGQYRAAIAVAAIALEQRLISLISGNTQSLFRQGGLTKMIRELTKQNVLSSLDAERLSSVINLRNKAVHANTGSNPTKGDAESVIQTVQAFLARTTIDNHR